MDKENEDLEDALLAIQATLTRLLEKRLSTEESEVFLKEILEVKEE